MYALDRRQRLQVRGAVGQIGINCNWMRLAPGTGRFNAPVSSATMRPLFDDRHPVAEAVGLVHVVRGEKERRPAGRADA